MTNSRHEILNLNPWLPKSLSNLREDNNPTTATPNKVKKTGCLTYVQLTHLVVE